LLRERNGATDGASAEYHDRSEENERKEVYRVSIAYVNQRRRRGSVYEAQ